MEARCSTQPWLSLLSRQWSHHGDRVQLEQRTNTLTLPLPADPETGDLVTSCALERGPEITEDRFRSASSSTENRRAEAASWGASGAMMAAQVNEDAWEMEAVGLIPRQTLKQGLRR